MKHAFLIIFLFICLKNYSQIKVSCTGTSITTGYTLPDSLSYPGQLQYILSKSIVGNFGVNSSTILHQTSSAYIQSSTYINAQNSNPNIVTMEFGTNDSKRQYWNIYKDSFASDYINFINVFKALETHPVIYACLPIPALSSTFSVSDSTITYAIIPLIDSIAAKNNIQVIDLNTPFKNHPEYYLSDGVHPNATGANVLAQIIAKAIAAPVGLTACVTKMRRVKLNWIINDNELGFSIQRSTDSVNWKTIYKRNANTTQLTDITFADSAKYFYRINASISAGSTAYSNVVSVVPNYNNTLTATITSSSIATGEANKPFSYTIKTANKAVTFNATGLPQGLTLNTSTGKITGTPVITQGSGGATFIVMLSATNAYGTVNKALKIYIAAAASFSSFKSYKLNMQTDKLITFSGQ